MRYHIYGRVYTRKVDRMCTYVPTGWVGYNTPHNIQRRKQSNGARRSCCYFNFLLHPSTRFLFLSLFFVSVFLDLLLLYWRFSSLCDGNDSTRRQANRASLAGWLDERVRKTAPYLIWHIEVDSRNVFVCTNQLSLQADYARRTYLVLFPLSCVGYYFFSLYMH